MRDNYRLKWIAAMALVAAAILSGCGTSGGETLNEPTVVPDIPTATQVPQPTSTPDPAAAVILQQPVLANGTLAVIGYTGPEGQCVALSFDEQSFVAQHCGHFEGDGVGFIDTITDPAGATVRLAYGLVLDATISAVAIEFTGGGNTNSFIENGSYLVLLEGGQTPRRATGVNPFGNMVGQWTFN